MTPGKFWHGFEIDTVNGWEGGNFGRRWYNVLIWSDFGVQGCRPCFSYPCQNLLVPLSKVNDDLTIIRLHWSSTQSSLSFYRPNYLLRALLYCTHHSYSILLHALVRSFSSSGALWAQEGLSTLTCKTSCAKQDTSKLLYREKTAWDVRWIMYFYLCCDVSWYSNFHCFAFVSWKSSMFKERLLCRGLSLRVRQFLHFLLLYMIQPQQTTLVNRISCCYVDDDSFFKHTDAKLFCNHLVTYIFFIIHHSWHSCAKKQGLQTKASQQLSRGTQSEADDFLFNSDK